MQEPKKQICCTKCWGYDLSCLNENCPCHSPEQGDKLDWDRIAVRNAVYSIINKEVAQEVWYESRLSEQRLVSRLQCAETKLVDYIQSLVTQERQKAKEEGRKEGFKLVEDAYNAVINNSQSK